MTTIKTAKVVLTTSPYYICISCLGIKQFNKANSVLLFVKVLNVLPERCTRLDDTTFICKSIFNAKRS